jgi:DNA-directed RNA polymerase specialized sigma24 family protein
MVQRDFGPMINALRNKLMPTRLAALSLILHHLGRRERIEQLLAVSYSSVRNMMGTDWTAQTYFAEIVGGEEALAALPTPPPAELEPERVALLVEDVIAEVRDAIARLPPAQPAPGRVRAT